MYPPQSLIYINNDFTKCQRKKTLIGDHQKKKLHPDAAGPGPVK